MKRAGRLIAFLGPSLPGDALSAPELEVRPPARKGDVFAALADRPAAIALLDGVFEASASVWHRELIAALEGGVAVFGAASMGAIRAAELDGEGMIGVGAIYQGFRDGTLVDDAEVALLHADEALGFRPLTVPLVNVRHAVRLAQKAGVLGPKEAQAMIATAEACFYAERTWPLLLERVGWPPATLRSWRVYASGGLEELKAVDARACLEVALAYVRSGAHHPPSSPGADSSWLRWLGLGAVQGQPTAEGERVLARRTLAGFARSFGLDALSPPPALDGTPAERARAAEEHLAKALLRAAVRLVPDGPSREEAEATARGGAGRRRRGRAPRGS